jgi:extradiol dioxygenase family protein
MVGFYCAALGCSVANRRDDLGLIHLKVGASMIDLISVGGKLGRAGGAPPGREGRNQDHLCIKVVPFDEQAIIKHLATLGVRPKSPASINFGAEGDGPSLYFSDPEGNVIELKGPTLSSSK